MTLIFEFVPYAGVEICDEATAGPCSANISVPCGLVFPAALCVCAQRVQACQVHCRALPDRALVGPLPG